MQVKSVREDANFKEKASYESFVYRKNLYWKSHTAADFFFFFFLYCWSFEKLFVLEYSWLYSNNIYTLCYNNVVIVSGGQQRDSAIDMLILFSRKFMSDSLWPRGLQHGRLICPSLSLRVCSNSRPLSWWCHPTILSSVAPFSSCPVFPSIRVFSSELAPCIRWPKYWRFSVSPSNWICRVDFL